VKLLFCRECNDVIRIVPEDIRECQCGKVKGRYLEDGYHAEYSGDEAIPVAFLNSSFAEAIREQPQEGGGYRFDAFVVPVKCDTFVKKEKL